ncbi:MAG: trimeric intracellular cation channel family protein, partial [Burkholderiales bacterium]
MPEHISMGGVWLALDLAGTAVFAISGAATGVKYRLDVFGVCVLAFVAGNAGGMLRDVLLGATPPAALSEWHHICRLGHREGARIRAQSARR